MKKRVKQVNELIKREISQIISRDMEFPEGILVTVSRVETLDNISQSSIFISVFPAGESRDIIKVLNSRVYEFQQKINKRLRMRPVPKIKFSIEEKTEEADRIEEILQELKNGEK